MCGGELRPTTITHEDRRGERLYLFGNVPAKVCMKCGEIWIEETKLQAIDRLIERGQPTRHVPTPPTILPLPVPSKSCTFVPDGVPPTANKTSRRSGIVYLIPTLETTPENGRSRVRSLAVLLYTSGTLFFTGGSEYPRLLVGRSR